MRLFHFAFFLLVTIGLNAQKLSPQDSLVQAAWEGQLGQVSDFFRDSIPLDKPDTYGLTALQASNITGRAKLAQWLEGRAPGTMADVPASEVLTDRLFFSRYEGRLPGASVLVARADTVLYHQAYGLARLDPDEPATTQTVFRIGSITKQFTAAAILLLAEEGKLSLEDSLSMYMPDFPGAEKVSLHMLLNHTSGIHSYTMEQDFRNRVDRPISRDSLIAEVASFDYDFEPGTDWRYNNSGYIILAEIIEQVSGKPYDQFLKDRIFAPLGMTHTDIYKNGKGPKGEAMGLAYTSGVLSKTKDWDMSWADAAGALYSTTGDLLKWNLALHTDQFLTEESLAAMYMGVSQASGQPTDDGRGYGYGMGIGAYRDQAMYSHSGGLDGFMSYLAYLPDLRASVIVLTNALPSDLEPASQFQGVIDSWFWPQLAEQQTYGSVAAKNKSPYDMYTGMYEYPQGAIMKIFLENNQLKAQLTGQPAMTIRPVGLDTFRWEGVDATISFFRNRSGQVDSARHNQSGQSFIAPKFEFPAEVAVDTSTFDRYAGTYSLGPAEIKVFREGEAFRAQLTGQPAVPIFAQAEDKYFFKLVRATLSFEEDPLGNISAVVLDQGGQEQRAVRKE